MNAPRNVLVVEDNSALSQLLGGLLDEAGYAPVTIADHALMDAAVDSWQPRCVILDGESWTPVGAALGTTRSRSVGPIRDSRY